MTPHSKVLPHLPDPRDIAEPKLCTYHTPVQAMSYSKSQTKAESKDIPTNKRKKNIHMSAALCLCASMQVMVVQLSR